MELIVIVIAVFGLVTCSIFFLLSPKRETQIDAVQRRLQNINRGGVRRVNTAPDASFWEQTALFFLGNKEAAPEYTKLRRLLYQAGYRHEQAVAAFWGVRICLILGLAGVLMAYGMWNEHPTLEVLMLVIGGALTGSLAPYLYLKMRARGRLLEIRETLPDTLDLLVVCTQAGMGLEAAFVRVGQEQAASNFAIGEELQLMNHEIRAGMSRREALNRLTERLGIDDISSLVSFINQSEEHGGSIARALLVYATTMREKRMQRAEEAARKAVIKLIFPLVFFIMPAFFLVIMALPIVQLTEFLGDLSPR